MIFLEYIKDETTVIKISEIYFNSYKKGIKYILWISNTFLLTLFSFYIFEINIHIS